MRNCIKHSAVRAPGFCPICFVEERDRMRDLLVEFWRFDLSPMFDAKGSYTGRKSKELRALQEKVKELVGEDVLYVPYGLVAEVLDGGG